MDVIRLCVVHFGMQIIGITKWNRNEKLEKENDKSCRWHLHSNSCIFKSQNRLKPQSKELSCISFLREYRKVRIIDKHSMEKKESRLLCNCKWLHALKCLQLLCRKKILPFHWRYSSVYILHARTKHDLRDISVFLE